MKALRAIAACIYGIQPLVLVPCFLGALSSLMASTASADIYMYRDSRGVLHFSNAPSEPQSKYHVPPPTRGGSTEAKREKPHPSEDTASQQGIGDKQDTELRKAPPPTAKLAGAGRRSEAPANAVLVVFATLATVAGYSMVGFVIRKIRENQLRTKARSSGSYEHYHAGQGEEEQGNGQEAGHEEAPRGTFGEEQKYARVLGLKGQVTISEVKKAYRELLGKYHPDKVNHLGDEFKEIAEEKTKAIIEAYGYFRKKYGMV